MVELSQTVFRCKTHPKEDGKTNQLLLILANPEFNISKCISGETVTEVNPLETSFPRLEFLNCAELSGTLWVRADSGIIHWSDDVMCLLWYIILAVS